MAIRGHQTQELGHLRRRRGPVGGGRHLEGERQLLALLEVTRRDLLALGAQHVVVCRYLYGACAGLDREQLMVAVVRLPARCGDSGDRSPAFPVPDLEEASGQEVLYGPALSHEWDEINRCLDRD